MEVSLKKKSTHAIIIRQLSAYAHLSQRNKKYMFTQKLVHECLQQLYSIIKIIFNVICNFTTTYEKQGTYFILILKVCIGQG